MKKLVHNFFFDAGKRFGKISLIMRCFLLFLLIFNFSVSAKSFSQNVKFNIELKNASFEQVLKLMEEQSDIGFIYDFQLVKQVTSLEIKLKNATVKKVLEKALKNTGLTYSFDQNIVIISKLKEASVSEEGKRTITGKVVDQKGNPLPGVAVVIQGTLEGTATDENGNYKIQASSKDALTFSFIGMKDAIFLVKDKKKIDVILYSEIQELEETTVVAFGEQKKESVVSAITTVRPMDLKSSNSDITSSFAGKIAGVIGWQTGGIPGALTEEEMNTKFYVRGITSFQTSANIDPLILIDGIESSKLDLARIAPEDIESFSVMKDASATAMYGARGANGVILVNTKKGEEGSVYTSVRYEAIASMPTREIDVVDPITYMKMYNRALISRSPSASPKYSVERIERTRLKSYPSWVYPATDWYQLMFKDHSINHHLGVNIRGGSKVIQYYASVNYNQDHGMLKTDRLNQFDCNIKNTTTSFRTNLNINLNAGIKLVINSSASFDKYRGPYTNMQQAYALAFAASPVDFAPMYPGDDTYNWPHLRFGASLDPKQLNPYMLSQQGYNERMRYSASSRAEYIQNLSSLIKGLELRGSVSMVKTAYSLTPYTTIPAKYSLEHYDFETGKHTLRALNPDDARRTLELVKSQQASTGSTQMTYEGRLLHTAAWNDHQTSLTAVVSALEFNATPVSSVLNGMEHRNLVFSMRGTYGFKDRYFAEASFGYNGSERFAEKNKLGFFPACGMAWIASKEEFMKPLSNWLSFLKFRASYGKVGNDGIIKEPRFVYLPLIDQSTAVGDPEPNGNAVLDRYRISSYANENIQWEIAEQANLGLEAKLFNGIVEFTADAYREIRHNIIANRTTIPASMGIEVPPMDNIGKVKSGGIDFSGKIQHAFSNDFWVILNGTFTYNKATYLEIEEATDKPHWQRKVGKEISQQVGYIAEGLFRDRAEIDNSPVQGGNVMPGDIRYRDLNKDGTIDVKDATYIGFPETPRVIYGFGGFVNYKNWEFNFSFQGSGKRSFFMNPKVISPFNGDHAMLTAIYNDYWSADKVSNKPFWPRLSTQNLISHNPQEDWYNANNNETRKSTYFMRKCNFLRCSGLELAYNVKKNLIRKSKTQNLKLFIRANNPFVITNFKIWDVELGENGFNYPIQKTYTAGLNFSF